LRKLAVGLAIGAGTVLMLSLLWGLQHAALSNPPVLGKPAPRLVIKPLYEDNVSLASYRGQPVVLNFWASWCGPCVDEAIVLAQGVHDHPNVGFLGADNRDTTAGYQSFEDEHRHAYPAGPIVEGSYQSYGVSGLPATFFIDAQGVVVASFTGPLSSDLLNHYLHLIE
jgi:cytochrome c biogenesis protein CcmG/thiol:disulfide interchange protein DsbE